MNSQYQGQLIADPAAFPFEIGHAKRFCGEDLAEMMGGMNDVHDVVWMAREIGKGIDEARSMAVGWSGGHDGGDGGDGGGDLGQNWTSVQETKYLGGR
ncbi:hypothetical protein ColLi_02252 [Colletotrichum liriopes]|uniref:Uncharacterized protein n=1 Tax=Colletotrichum liriopes TaxID=708192 RepID=A0AA37GEV2_9PEZI|nr:hypothetical protein ColLi_02252 [Colletotrichum liriopes]